MHFKNTHASDLRPGPYARTRAKASLNHFHKGLEACRWASLSGRWQVSFHSGTYGSTGRRKEGLCPSDIFDHTHERSKSQNTRKHNAFIPFYPPSFPPLCRRANESCVPAAEEEARRMSSQSPWGKHRYRRRTSQRISLLLDRVLSAPNHLLMTQGAKKVRCRSLLFEIF